MAMKSPFFFFSSAPLFSFNPTTLLVYIDTHISHSFSFLVLQISVALMDDSSSEDLFSLINFSGEQEEHLSEPPQPSSSTSVVSHKHITFMEPNIDVLIDYPVNKLYEKYFRQNELPCNIK